MKQIHYFISFLLLACSAGAQQVVSTFETFSLSPNSYYQDSSSTPFVTQNAGFEYHWDNQFNYWKGGFSYSNVHDSTTAGSANQYAVIAYKGYNNSETFVVGQQHGRIALASQQNTVEGFYITNTTYAYKSMRLGDSFARKFGDTTGTGTGGSIAQGSYPDFFKVTIKGYNGGIMKSDSVEFYLADYRSSNNNLDYIVDTWQWVNTSSLGEVDSIRFFMYSSDVGAFGINTPLYFAIDNFTTKGEILGLQDLEKNPALLMYPNPCSAELNLEFGDREVDRGYRLLNMHGQSLKEGSCSEKQTRIDTGELSPGMYLFESIGANRQLKVFVKQ